MSWNKNFLVEFIELLREHEVLWKIKHKDYHNHTKRIGCYEVLLRKMKEVDTTADISKVQKKNNNLRTVFRKELKKVEASRGTGRGTDDIYVPKLWYYENLMFLKDQEQPYGATSSSMDTQSDDESTENTIEEIGSPRSDIASVERFSEPRGEPQQKRSFKRQKNLSASQHVDRTIETIGNKICEITADDKYDAFGNNVAHKLRSLPTNQRLFAEKIINDALFEAEMGNLNRQCFLHVLTQSFPTSHSQNLQPLPSQVLNFQAREPLILQSPKQRFVHTTQPSTQQQVNCQEREPLILQQSTQAIVHATQPSIQQLNFHTREPEEECQVNVHIPGGAQTFYNTFSVE